MLFEHSHVVFAVFAAAVLSLIIIFTIRQCLRTMPHDDIPSHQIARSDSRAEISLRHSHHSQALGFSDAKTRGDYYMFGAGKPLFSWSDHPSLVTDAVENGWSRFAFAGHTTAETPPRSSARGLLGLCAAGDARRETEPETSWEICHDSADFMQKVRLNPGLRRPLNNGVVIDDGTSALSAITTALPLPGPPLGKSSSFPQEAYFEITVLHCHGGGEERDSARGKVSEGEKTKLIQESSNARANSESLVYFGGNAKVEELKPKEEDRAGGKDAVMLSVGLTAGGFLPLKLPGSYPGSIGFNSDGSVYVDGIKLVFASENAEWGRAEKVIGCGFDPKQKKVIFTVDSEVIHLVHCKSDEFGTPLYPTLAANSDSSVLVNFGQSVFKYVPANAHRTPNPCFIGTVARSPAALGYDDSKELFSMGRIDSQWLNRWSTRGGQTPVNARRDLDYDEESEADLFEIVLESAGKSPNVIS